MNIVLVGMMGSGKSSVGRILAQALGRPFVDTDEAVEAAAGRQVAEIFAAEGEAGFRELEAAVVAEVAGRDGQVIATGGGAVLRAENRAALRRTGVVFWLDAPAAELYRRTARAGAARRPLLADSDPLGRLSRLAEERAGAYAAIAHHRIETEALSPQAVAEAILAVWRAGKGAEGNAPAEG